MRGTLKEDKLLLPHLVHTEAEVLYAVRNEMAVKPNDVVCRRLGVGILNEADAKQLLPKVVDIMGRELNWSKQKKNDELEEALSNLKWVK